MSIYDQIKSQFDPAPAYPRKSDFQTVYGYAGGKVLGTFESATAAKKAGAATTDVTTDEVAYKAAQTVYADHALKVSTAYQSRLRAEYPEISDKVYAIAYDQAYENGHSAGYGEVEIYLDRYVDMAKSIIAAVAE